MIQVERALRAIHYSTATPQLVQDQQTGEATIVMLEQDGTAHVFPLNGPQAQAVEDGLRAIRGGVQVARTIPQNQDGHAD